MFLRSSTYTAVADKLARLRQLRKIKLFPSVGAVTVVTYYKQYTDGPDYIGRAHLITFTTLEMKHIELAHNSRLPPPMQAQAEEEEDLEDSEPTSDPLPAFGCYYQPFTYTY